MTEVAPSPPRPGGSEVTALEPAHVLAERALAINSGSVADDGRVVLIEDGYEAELRFANNTATTNGARRRRRITVETVTRAGTAPPPALPAAAVRRPSKTWSHSP